MVFSVLFSVTLILLISFCVTKRVSLKLFEVLFIYMLFIFIHHSVFTVLALNLNLITFPKDIHNYWTLVFIRITLVPLLIIWFLDRWLTTSIGQRLLLFPVGVALMVGIDYLGHFLRIYQYHHWNLGLSVSKWSALLLVMYLNLIWFRKILTREVGEYDARAS